jgi:gamma-glutamyltranspeptidase/glutathione hydrolase
VAGWGSLHALGAKLGWAAAFDHAIGHARAGVAVTPSLKWALGDAAPAFEADAGMAAVFGRSPGLGATVRQPALAATLERIAAHGWRELYEGETGRRLASFLQASGSRLDRRDLAGFAVEETPPLTGRFRGLRLLTSPPNASGVLLLQALAALEEQGDHGDWLGADAGRLAIVLRAGAEQRSRMLADPRTHPFDAGAWLDPLRLAELGTEAPRPDPAGAGAPPTGDTVAVVAADGDGLAVSLIQSLFSSMGSRVLDPETGVLLHNRGALFTLEPGHANELAGGKRPAHTLLPVVVERDGALAGVLGTMGGNAHAQILTQVLLELLSGSSAADAVAAPRWIVGALDPGAPDTKVTVESAVSSAARRSLAAAGLAPASVEWPSEEVGHAQAVWHDGETVTAGSDPRADGRPLAG